MEKRPIRHASPPHPGTGERDKTGRVVRFADDPEKTPSIDALLSASYDRLIGEMTHELLARQSLSHFITGMLKRLGEVTRVSRVYLIAYNRDNNTVSTVAEWVAAGILPSRGEFQDIPVNRFPGLRDTLLAGRAVCIASRESASDEALKLLMEHEGTFSLMLLPFNVFGVPYGFIGFDACRGPREWSGADVDLMRSACHIMAQAIEKHRWEDEVIKIERMAAMGRLAGAVAHEINNPLQSIILNLDLLKGMTGQDEKTHRYIHSMEEGVHRISDIAMRILHLYREQPEMEDVDINDIVSGSVMFFERQMDVAHCTHEVRLASRLPPVRGMRQLIHQVFLNVVVNAIESLRDGGHIKISTSVDGDSVIVEVIDNGIGISADDLPFIFEPFYSSKKPKSAGLGLFIAHAIVTSHGGSIIVESEQGRGTVVRIRLPIQQR